VALVGRHDRLLAGLVVYICRGCWHYQLQTRLLNLLTSAVDEAPPEQMPEVVDALMNGPQERRSLRSKSSAGGSFVPRLSKIIEDR